MPVQPAQPRIVPPRSREPHATAPEQELALARASQALWLATLALMTAFMHTAAPAHRLLLARRIVCNFETLQEQPCFDEASLESFRRLHERWSLKVRRLTPEGERDEQAGWDWLRRVLFSRL